MSNKCSKCGIVETNDPSGVCAICRIDAKIEEEYNKNNKSSPMEHIQQCSSGQGDEKMEFKGGHKKCIKDGCARQQWKDHLCYRHYFQEHPEAERPGRKISGGVRA